MPHRSPLESEITAFAFHPEGKRLAVGILDDALGVFDPDTGKMVLPARGLSLGWHGLVLFAPDCKSLFVRHDDTTLHCDLATGRVLRTLPGPFPCAISPSGQYLLLPICGETQDGKEGPSGLRAIALPSGQELWTQRGDPRSAYIARLPHGAEEAAVIAGKHGPRLVDLRTGMVLPPIASARTRSRLDEELIVDFSHNLQYVLTRKKSDLIGTYQLRRWGTGELVQRLAAKLRKEVTGLPVVISAMAALSCDKDPQGGGHRRLNQVRSRATVTDESKLPGRRLQNIQSGKVRAATVNFSKLSASGHINSLVWRSCVSIRIAGNFGARKAKPPTTLTAAPTA